jgi:ATPase subunit of ABC transporter with duplicated ATPase domains
LEIEGLEKSVEGEVMFKGLNLRVDKGDKIAFVGMEHNSKSAFFDIVNGRNPKYAHWLTKV